MEIGLTSSWTWLEIAGRECDTALSKMDPVDYIQMIPNHV